MLNDLFPRSEVIFHLTDVSKQHDVANAFKEVIARFKAIDLVVTCAGILDEQNYKEMVDVNLVGILLSFLLNLSNKTFPYFNCYIARSDTHELYRNIVHESKNGGQRWSYCQHIIGDRN